MFLFKFKIKTLILIYLNYLSVILIFLEKSIKYYLTSRKDNRMKEKRKPKKKSKKDACATCSDIRKYSIKEKQFSFRFASHVFTLGHSQKRKFLNNQSLRTIFFFKLP